MYNLSFVLLLISVAFRVNSASAEIFPEEFGGVEVQPHSIPFIVSLVFKSEEKNVFFCTGSLLNEQWILTASQCLDIYPEIHVVAGHHAMDTFGNTTQVRKAFAVYRHKPMLNDNSDCMGLIYVENGFKFNQDVQPVILGVLSSDFDDKLTIQGWGASLSSKVHIYPENLRSNNLSMISEEHCKAAYPKDFDDKYNFCGRRSDRVACVEQPGGPVLQNGFQVGFVPWRAGECDTTADILIFTKILPYSSWIQDQVFQSSTLDVASRETEDIVKVVEPEENNLIQMNISSV